MTDTIHAFMQLLKYSIKPDFQPDEDIFTEKTLADVYKLSKNYDLAHMVANSILNSGHAQKDSELWQHFEQQMNLALIRTVRIKYEYDMICGAFEEKRIPYLPLKGVVICNLYPQFWMRTSCDMDILVHSDNLSSARKALEKKNYRIQDDNYHDISMLSPSGINLELHFNITENLLPMDYVLKKVWEYTAPVPDAPYRYELSAEYQIFYCIAHMAHHFYTGGCGIRPILDLWILENKLSYNTTVLNALLEKAGLLKFYCGVHKLVAVWFEDEQHNTLSKSMEVYILRGGVYGNILNAVAVKKTRKQSKLVHLLTRVFPPYCIMKEKNKVLRKAPFLLPLCWAQRLLSLIFSREKQIKILNQIKMKQSVSAERIDAYTDMLTELGLINIK